MHGLILSAETQALIQTSALCPCMIQDMLVRTEHHIVGTLPNLGVSDSNSAL